MTFLVVGLLFNYINFTITQLMLVLFSMPIFDCIVRLLCLLLFSTIAATQFEAPDARRAFPCFDEPAQKAKFTVTLIHDPKMIALSNSPIESSKVEDGWKYDTFKETVKMSTYLVAFVICDFDFKEVITNNNVKVRYDHDKICFESRNINTLSSLRVVFRRAVVGDFCFDYLSGRHLQSQGSEDDSEDVHSQAAKRLLFSQLPER